MSPAQQKGLRAELKGKGKGKKKKNPAAPQADGVPEAAKASDSTEGVGPGKSKGNKR